MSWEATAFFTNDILGTILVIRLLSLRLHRVYRTFCAYLVYVLFSLTAIVLPRLVHWADYRVLYLVFSVIGWVLTVWMVYELLNAILARLPGILRFSRIFLLCVLIVAALVAALTTKSEYQADRVIYSQSHLELAVMLSGVLERAVTTAALIALLSIQGFVLWFPVQLPRNLVLFSIGFSANFVCETILLVIRGVLPGSARNVIDPVNLFVLSGCLIFFIFAISRAGEFIPMSIGHRWRHGEQQTMVRKLEDLNVALLRSVRH